MLDESEHGRLSLEPRQTRAEKIKWSTQAQERFFSEAPFLTILVLVSRDCCRSNRRIGAADGEPFASHLGAVFGSPGGFPFYQPPPSSGGCRLIRLMSASSSVEAFPRPSWRTAPTIA